MTLKKVNRLTPGSGNAPPDKAVLNAGRATPLTPIANAPEAIFMKFLLLCIIGLVLIGSNIDYWLVIKFEINISSFSLEFTQRKIIDKA
jgi:hypothetical protein